jgi:ribosomal protein S4
MKLLPNFIAKRPSYIYKTSKFYFLFFALRNRINFGLRQGKRKKPSYVKRYYYLKRFFLWFYGLKNNFRFRRFFKQFQKHLINKRFGLFLNIIYTFERYLYIYLYRLGFSVTIDYSQLLIRLGLVFVNGLQIKNIYYIVGISNIVEVLTFYFSSYFNFLKYNKKFFYSNYILLINYFFRQILYFNFLKYKISNKIFKKSKVILFKKNIKILNLLTFFY